MDNVVILRFEEILKQGILLNKAEAQLKYGTSTTGTQRNIIGGIQVSTEDEVVEVVKVANEFSIPLYTISTGKNWGFGSSLPAKDGCLILDLSRLDSILNFEPLLGFVTLQPGVTQEKLAIFLAEQGGDFLTPTTPAHKSCSIIGNALEYGQGASLLMERFESIISMRVLLADGTILEQPLSTAEVSAKFGLGPSLMGIFAQSNIGIVLRATFKLARKPEFLEVFSFSLKKQENMASLLNNARILFQNLGDSLVYIKIQSKERMLNILEPYPKIEEGQKTISSYVLNQLAKKNNITDWYIIGAIQGRKNTIGGIRQEVRDVLGGYSFFPLFFFTRSSILLIKKIVPRFLLRPYFKKLDLMEGMLFLLEGHPQGTTTNLPFWKHVNSLNNEEFKRFREANLNPDNDPRVGFLLFTGILNLKGEKFPHVYETMAGIFKKYNFDFLPFLTVFADYFYHVSLPILFNKGDEDEMKRAHDCYRELVRQGLKNEFPPYRVNNQFMDEVLTNNRIFWEVNRKIKKSLDKNSIFSPGRYS